MSAKRAELVVERRARVDDEGGHRLGRAERGGLEPPQAGGEAALSRRLHEARDELRGPHRLVEADLTRAGCLETIEGHAGDLSRSDVVGVPVEAVGAERENG